MRNMGGLWNKIPFTFTMMTIGTLAIIGFGIPHTEIGLAGFFSKDAIIEAAYAASEHSGPAMIGFVSTVVAALFTSFYSWRLVFMTFFGPGHDRSVAESHAEDEPTAVELAHGDGHAHPHADAHHHDDHAHDDHGHGHHAPHESPLVMLVPLAVLALGAVAAGYVFDPYFVGHDYISCTPATRSPAGSAWRLS
jgi:NADH-quinone oxidoreductase subunit L